MANLTNAEIKAARERGRVARLKEPRALSVAYDRDRKLVVVELNNDCMVSIPAKKLQGLEKATAAELDRVVIEGDGYGLYWPILDVDLSVPGLLAGLFGTKAHMARLAGKARSAAKAEAARKNGAKGGRPKKLATA